MYVLCCAMGQTRHSFVSTSIDLAVRHQGSCDHVICRDGEIYTPNGLGVLPPWDRASGLPGPPSFLPLAFLRGEKLGFLSQWEGAARPAAVGASSDSAGWGVFMSSRNGCKSGTSVHLWPGHPLPYPPLALKSFQRGLEPERSVIKAGVEAQPGVKVQPGVRGQTGIRIQAGGKSLVWDQG